MKSKPLYRFGAWTVTRFGIECSGREYSISVAMLRSQGQDWLRQMSEKRWCNLRDFADAFHVACDYHKIQVEFFPVNPDRGKGAQA